MKIFIYFGTYTYSIKKKVLLPEQTMHSKPVNIIDQTDRIERKSKPLAVVPIVDK